jgi:glucose-1-phosphatase
MSVVQNVEGLLFDMGGIVININFDLALRAWEECSALSIEEIRRRFKLDTPYEQHERGEIDAAEYFNHLRNVLELDASDAEIAFGWNAIYIGEIVETVNTIRSVRDKLPCFAFTNSNPTHQTAWMAAYPGVVACFHQVFVSSELGLRKPDPKAFDAIADATGIGLDAMLFFDDTEENVVGARDAGLQAIHVKTPSDVKKALVEINVL